MTDINNVKTDSELLDAFIKVAPFLNQLTHDDITIGIYDTEKLIINIPGETFSLNVTPGDPLAEGDIITKAIRENQQKSEIVPKELFGFPLIARAIPLHDEKDTVIGGVGLGTSLEKANKLHEVAESLSAVVEQSASSIQEVTSSINELAQNVTNVSSQVKEVNESTEEIGEVSTVVKGISEQSNLLGLNASIEAARAGDAGKGFGVVAEEIRKLANNSKDNVKKIDDATQKIQSLITELDGAFAGIHKMTDSQAAAIQEISSTIQEISTNAQDLAQLAEKQIYADK
ncbi:Methyl-accepting chemotaxis protein (MCP) signalling domain-containing protein [Salinibacillus kushneri]|uniref:Methyl-accepting chemotaxis protein (MCP) signalling domain-containing protein n=1 Tax=Salinibacillus kushneri TaxID=237682 RepID=A0A1I0GVH8_9BACI|nr:methyl-accepting chemotaxis protein [Salinibacillus kushneri]SET75383.1 Methyl-accepting chemotaxis protein (MCP) signalling domain-containing protein [Salinibacillus kushneri]